VETQVSHKVTSLRISPLSSAKQGLFTFLEDMMPVSHKRHNYEEAIDGLNKSYTVEDIHLGMLSDCLHVHHGNGSQWQQQHIHVRHMPEV